MPLNFDVKMFSALSGHTLLKFGILLEKICWLVKEIYFLEPDCF